MIIESTTVKFLKDLDKNNNREWFLAHKVQYEAALDNIKQFKDHVVKGLNKKDVIEDARVFRIYRDVRFSKDKAPYKNNFGIHFTSADTFLISSLNNGSLILFIRIIIPSTRR